MTTPATYISFLIRLWREPEWESDSTADWHSEVRHIQSSRCWTFASLDETLEFLRRRVGGPEALSLDGVGETKSGG
jgi:hypothetical protein